jgi:hypothetical protein
MTTLIAALLFAAAQDGVIPHQPPKEWTKEEPANSMRKAQYRIPDKEKKAKDAELILFFFGPNAGGVEANLKRWAGQMGQTEYKAEKIEGKCKITLVDLKGPYQERPDKDPIAEARMLAAVVETDKGPWFFKLVGPAATAGGWREEFITLLKGAGF